MKPLRVLLVAPSLDILGGQAVQAARLFASLQTEPSVQVTFLPVNPPLPGPLALLQRVKYVRTIVTFIGYAISLFVSVRKQDVLHVFAAAYTSFLLAAAPAILVCRFFKKKVILNYHDGRAEDHLGRWPRSMKIMRRASAIVAPSEFLVGVFARFGLPARSILNHLDLANFHYRERPMPLPTFLHNRALEPLYNPACALRTFAIVQRRHPNASLVMANDGPLRPDLERLVKDLGLMNVRFIGRKPPEQMPALLDAAGIYITTPDIDNMPVSLLECYAAGLPVIATRVGGIPYILENGRTGLLAEAHDAAGLAACALRYLEEEGLAVRIARAARAECDRFSWANVGPQWLRLYGER